jgi:hypothetical protein
MTEHGGSGRDVADPSAAIRLNEPFAISSANGLTRGVGAHQEPGRHHESASPWPSERALGAGPAASWAVADDVPAPGGANDLRSLLLALKVTRQRRDDSDFGSPEWRKADDDLRDLQHAIFVVGIEDPTPARSPEHDPE